MEWTKHGDTYRIITGLGAVPKPKALLTSEVYIQNLWVSKRQLKNVKLMSKLKKYWQRSRRLLVLLKGKITISEMRLTLPDDISVKKIFAL